MHAENERIQPQKCEIKTSEKSTKVPTMSLYHLWEGALILAPGRATANTGWPGTAQSQQGQCNRTSWRAHERQLRCSRALAGHCAAAQVHRSRAWPARARAPACTCLLCTQMYAPRHSATELRQDEDSAREPEEADVTPHSRSTSVQGTKELC